MSVEVRAGVINCVRTRRFLTRWRKQKVPLLGCGRKNDGVWDKKELDRKPKREEGQKEGYTNRKLTIDTKE
jgi:hypothetical protein